MPAKKGSRTHHKSPPSTGRLKDAKIAVDIKRGQQDLLEPFVPFQFDLTTSEGFSQFTHNLIKAALEHRIDNRVGGMVNGAVANYIRYTQPPQGVNVTVTQQVAAIDYSRFVKLLPEDEQIVLAKAVRNIEAKAQSSSQ